MSLIVFVHSLIFAISSVLTCSISLPFGVVLGAKKLSGNSLGVTPPSLESSIAFTAGVITVKLAAASPVASAAATAVLVTC